MFDPARALSRRAPFYYGWIVVLVGFVTLGMGASTRSLFSLLFPPILAEFGWERGLTASIFSIGFLLASLTFPWVGAAIDRYGPQRTLPAGILVTAAGFALTTIATTPLQFTVTLGIMGIGASMSFAYNGHFVFLPNWFESKRGLAIGLVAAGGGAVAFVLIPQVQLLIDAGGWRTGCLVMATVLVVVVAPLNMLLQRRRPQDLGALPDGGTVANASATTRREVLIVDAQWAATEWTLPRAMRTLRFWCFSMGFFLAMFVWYGVLVHQTKYLIDLGFDSTLAAWALGLVPTFGVGGQITLGYLADRIGREWVWTFACTGFLASYVCLLMLPQYPNAALVWAMVVTQGFLGYGVTPAIGAIPADLFQGKQYGRIFGVTAVFGSSGGAVGPWVVGEIFDRTGSYDLGWIVAIAACVLSILLIWVAAPRKVRRVAFVQPSSLEPASP